MGWGKHPSRQFIEDPMPKLGAASNPTAFDA